MTELEPLKDGGEEDQKEGSEENPFYEIDIRSLSLKCHLGRGTFGAVQKAEWKGIPVAVKIIQTDNDSDRKSFIREMNYLRKLKHPNIVKVYGACSRPEIALVMELMDNGSVHDILHNRVDLIYKADHLFSWAKQCADAVSFIHSKGYVHRDLKPPNLLLKNGYRLLKVCDFGTVSPVRSKMSNNKGTVIWMAPEVFSSSSYDEKCDVYSFGIMLWEMITRRRPFEDIDGPPLTIVWKAYSGVRPPPIANCPDVLMNLIARCWDKDPKMRPEMHEVFKILSIFTEIFADSNSPLECVTAVGQSAAQSPTRRHVVPSITINSAASQTPVVVSNPPSTKPQIQHSKSYSDSGFSHSTERKDSDSYSFLRYIDPDLRPIAPYGNEESDQDIYFTQIAACRELYETEKELKASLVYKHQLIDQVRKREERRKLLRTRDHLRSLLRDCENRIAAQRRPCPP